SCVTVAPWSWPCACAWAPARQYGNAAARHATFFVRFMKPLVMVCCRSRGAVLHSGNHTIKTIIVLILFSTYALGVGPLQHRPRLSMRRHQIGTPASARPHCFGANL